MKDQKVVSLQKYKLSQKMKRCKTHILQNIQENKKMLFLVIIISLFLASFLWNHFVENPSRLDVQIPQSNNITFNHEKPVEMTDVNITKELRYFSGKPVLLYIYTTWCSSCKKQFPVINDISREFQNTQLQVMSLAIDRDLTADFLQKYFNQQGELYFKPRYLGSKKALITFLKQKGIQYQGRIPYTILISETGEVVTKFIGSKSKNYLRNKIIKEIY